MVDAVLPEAVLSPAITMVPADQDILSPESVEDRLQPGVHKLEAHALPFRRDLGVVVAAKGDTGVLLRRPGGAFEIIGHVCLTDVHEDKGRPVSFLRHGFKDPLHLALKRPGIAREKKLVKIPGQGLARIRAWIKPPHGPGPDGPEPPLLKSIYDIFPFEGDVFRAPALEPAVDHLENPAEFRVQKGLIHAGYAGGEAHEHGHMG